MSAYWVSKEHVSHVSLQSSTRVINSSHGKWERWEERLQASMQAITLNAASAIQSLHYSSDDEINSFLLITPNQHTSL
jgi:hypothetical protein